MCWRTAVVVAILASLQQTEAVSADAEGRFLVELEEADQAEGIGPFLEKHLEPFGAVVVAYVDPESPNHRLMRKLVTDSAKNGTTKLDQALYDLQPQVAAAVEWRRKGDEELTIEYRQPFSQLWGQLDPPMTPMDAKPAVFPSKPGEKWKMKDVKKWLLEFAYPTVNIRNMDTHNKGQFPIARYYGRTAMVNDIGSVLVFANLVGDNEFVKQFQVSRVLRPWAEKYRGKLRFTFVERTKKTSELRADFSMGADKSIDVEMLLIEGLLEQQQLDTNTNNHWHGNPKKYRLRNFTQGAVDQFFQDYEKGALPTYWISKEPWTWDAGKKPQEETVRLTGSTYDSWVFDENPERARLVGFFNDDPKDGCVKCETNRPIWEKLAKEVKGTKRLRTWFDIAAIDQSANEHPENKVPGKLGDNIVMYYPPGSRKERKKKGRQLHQMAEHFSVEYIMKKMDDMVFQFEEDMDEKVEL